VKKKKGKEEKGWVKGKEGEDMPEIAFASEDQAGEGGGGCGQFEGGSNQDRTGACLLSRQEPTGHGKSKPYKLEGSHGYEYPTIRFGLGGVRWFFLGTNTG